MGILTLLELFALVIAIVLFLLAGLSVPSPRFSLGWFGAMFLAIFFLLITFVK